MIKFILLLIEKLFSKKQPSVSIEIEEGIIIDTKPTVELDLDYVIIEELDKEEHIDTGVLIPEEEEVKKDPYYSNFTIVVEAGHSEETTEKTGGKRTPNFPNGTYIEEYHINKAHAEFTVQELEAIGFNAELFLYPKEASFDDRADAYNKIEFKSRMAGRTHIVISMHADAHQPDISKIQWTEAGGTTAFYWRKAKKNAKGEIMKDEDGKTLYDLSQEGRDLAAFIQKRMVEVTGFRDRSWSVERAKSLGANWAILRKTAGVSCLIEVGFMTNRIEAEKMKSESFRRLVGRTVAFAIKDYADSKR